MSRTSRLLVRAAAVVALALASAVTVAAQSPAQRERERRERDDREREAEFDLLLTEDLRRVPERRAPRPNLTKIREDYIQLQVTNNELARAAAEDERLDLKAVAAAAAEIRKRAERLRENLALPEPEREDERTRAAEPEGLKPTLAALDELILKFVRNPLFASPKLVDLRHSASAARDLERIISLSNRVRKLCDKSRAAADAKPE